MFGVQPKKSQYFTSSISYIFKGLKIRLLHTHSQRQKSMYGYLIRMEWPYFQSLKNIRSTARKALKLFWLIAQHSEVSKMVCYVLLARLDPAQSYEEFAFFIKNGLFSVIFAEKGNSL